MAQHRTPRGEESTFRANGGKSKSNHVAKHAVAGNETSPNNSSKGTPKLDSRLRWPGSSK